jgi:hypothetical protein
MEERDHYEDLDVDVRTVIKWILREVGWRCGLDSSGSGQRPAWALVNTVMGLESSCVTEQLLVSQEGSNSFESVSQSVSPLDHIAWNDRVTNG